VNIKKTLIENFGALQLRNSSYNYPFSSIAQQDTWILSVCQARSKSEASFLSYKQKNDFQKDELCVSTGEMYLTMYVELADDHFGVGLM